MSKFRIGDPVKKTKGDYRYRGDVRGIITKRNKSERLVVENDDGMLFIFNESQLEYDHKEPT